MKKLFALLIALIMVFSLAACGNDNDTTSDNETDNPGLSQNGENNGGEDNSGTTEPDNTGDNSTENNEGDTWTVESFLKFYGFNAEDLKPNHFTSFEDVMIDDGTEVGKRNSKGTVLINVEKGKTTADDYNAWFENMFAKIAEQSVDGKRYYTAGNAMEALTLDELKAELLWDTSPGSMCYITVYANGKAIRINIGCSYDKTEEQYKITIMVHSVSSIK